VKAKQESKGNPATPQSKISAEDTGGPASSARVVVPGKGRPAFNQTDLAEVEAALQRVVVRRPERSGRVLAQIVGVAGVEVEYVDGGEQVV